MNRRTMLWTSAAIALLSIAAATAAEPTGARGTDAGGRAKPIPPFSEVRQAVLRYFQARPDYRSGDLITREDVRTAFSTDRAARIAAARRQANPGKTARQEQFRGATIRRRERPQVHAQDRGISPSLRSGGSTQPTRSRPEDRARFDSRAWRRQNDRVSDDRAGRDRTRQNALERSARGRLQLSDRAHLHGRHAPKAARTEPCCRPESRQGDACTTKIKLSPCPKPALPIAGRCCSRDKHRVPPAAASAFRAKAPGSRDERFCRRWTTACRGQAARTHNIPR